MAVRMTGLMSNMDTESIIKDLMKAQSIKKTRVENKKTKLDWTQEKWKDLNSKIYKFYTDQASKMRLQGSYQTKKSTSSNEDKVSVTSSASAPPGSQTLEITQLASTQYITGGQVSASGITTTSRLVGDLGMSNGTVISIKSNTASSSKTVLLDVDTNTTVGDFVQKCKDAGLTASYDATQKRFFISAAASGEDNTFAISATGYDTNATDSRDDIRSLVGYTSLNSTDKATIDNAIDVLRNANPSDASYVSANQTVETAIAKFYATNQVKSELKDAIVAKTSYGGKDYSHTYENLQNTTWENIRKSNKLTATLAEAETLSTKDPATLSAEESKVVLLYNGKYQTNLANNLSQLVATDLKSTANTAEIKKRTDELYANTSSDAVAQSDVNALKTQLASAVSVINGTTPIAASLNNMGLGEITTTSEGTDATSGMVAVKGQNSEIKLNNALIEGTSNIMKVNGLTLNLKAETAPGEVLTIGVSQDTDTVYNMVKGFVKEYNTLLKEMNTLYYASTAKGYDPLTDEEKEAMTDDQIEKWETKIKDSLLRRDDKLGSLTSSLKLAMMGSTDVNGKQYSLSSFGIMTSTDYTEKGLLHIYGDTEDATYSFKEDKLKKALAEDPNTVIEALSEITTNLYNDMTKKMQTTTLNSALTFYNDKEITKQLKQYDTQINEWESRLKKIEDRYYKQFSAMETAMAKLNSQSSSLAGMLGSS